MLSDCQNIEYQYIHYRISRPEPIAEYKTLSHPIVEYILIK
jgi:hypothetical protein